MTGLAEGRALIRRLAKLVLVETERPVRSILVVWMMVMLREWRTQTRVAANRPIRASLPDEIAARRVLRVESPWMCVFCLSLLCCFTYSWVSRWDSHKAHT